MVNPTDPFMHRYSSKPYYDILLDDRAGLISALSTLLKTITLYKQWISDIPNQVKLTREQISTLLSEYEINKQ